MIKKSVAVFFFVAAFFLIRAHAQSIRILSTKDGLPQSYIVGLVQDDSSLVWIGTRNGLARYDGIQYKIFLHKFNDSSTIASNIINGIYKDSHNNLWLFYESGSIDKMNPVSEHIDHFFAANASKRQFMPFVKRGWMVDSHGVFWGISRDSGLFSYDSLAQKKVQYDRRTAQFPSDTLRGLFEDSSRKIWVLGQSSISWLNRSANRFIHINLPYQQDYNSYFAFAEDIVEPHQRRNGEIMWGDRQQLYFFNPSNQTFRTVALPGRSEIGVRWIHTGADGAEYFESRGIIYRYDDFSGLSEVCKTSLSDGDTRSFLVDRSGLIWVGTNAAGIYQIDLITPLFRSFNDKNDFPQKLLKQELGISMENLFNWREEDWKFSAPGYHFRSFYDRQMRLWMGLKETVCYYDFQQKKLTLLPTVPIETGSVHHGIGIKGITIGPGGVPIVIGFNGNLFSYDAVAKSWKPMIEQGMLRKTFAYDLLPVDIIADAHYLWISTSNDGLLYMDMQTKQVRQIKTDDTAASLPTNQLIGLMADPGRPDILWIGSYAGLVSFDKKTMKCTLYSIEDGLPDNTIYSMTTDNSGNFWLSTNKGLCRFNPETHAVRVFHTSHGLPGDEFNRFHDFKFPDGRLAFGGTEGWTLFDPHLIKDDDFNPPVSLTSLRINNIQVNPSAGSSILKSPINSVTHLILPYSDNTIAINFAGLEFNQPRDLQYRYQLKGYDDNWVMTGNTAIASYTKISPGHYTLVMNSSNTSGKWSRYVKTIGITILPPWYRTWWAYLCYGIILFGFGWSFVNFRIKRILFKQELGMKEKEAVQMREIDDMKTKFFSNITHEFRTPLTLILGPAEELRNRHQDDQRQNQLTNIITKNARQLLLLINQLMELARLEAKLLIPPERIGNLGQTIRSVTDSFENEAQTKNIRLSVNTSEVEQNYWFSPEVVERIIYNLVSNALKFTPGNGEIGVIADKQKKGIRLVVKDTGIGIPEDKLPYIFDRFYQAHGEKLVDGRLVQGTGIGLALVKELVDAQRGTIEVESQAADTGAVQHGTLFTIELPFRIVEEAAEIPGAKSMRPGSGDAEDDNGPRILLAEDNEELAAFIEGSLRENYSVYHFSNGALAWENAVGLMPDIIISDVLMPVMNGFELTKKIKGDFRTNHIPVILLTAKASQESKIEGLSYGANDYLTKPFLQSELLLKIRNLLDQQNRLREHLQRELSTAAALPAAPATAENLAEPPQDEFLSHVYKIIEEHLDDPLFGVEGLVSKIEMSRTSLHRKIKTVTGISTGDIIRNYRLRRSTGFLLQGNNITDTAYMSGFGSAAYFIKCFRELYGITPGEFIRRNTPS